MEKNIISDRLKYIKFCSEEESIPLFSQAWWLDGVCSNNWDILIVERYGEIVATMPYFKKRKYIFDVITMPPFTQTIGIWQKRNYKINKAQQLNFEADIINELVTKIPKVHKFTQNFHHSFNYWIPFARKKYKQRLRYTYILKEIKNLDLIFGNFKKNIRAAIRKARNNNITIEQGQDIETLLELYKMTFDKQNLKIPYSFDTIRKIHQNCLVNKIGYIFIAKDALNRAISSTFIVWDKSTAYAIIGGLNYGLEHKQANSLMFWEAIKSVSSFCDNFDFEGSMLKNVEPFFASFNATPKPYLQIYKKFRPFF